MIKIYEDTDRTTIKFYLDDIFWYFLVFSGILCRHENVCVRLKRNWTEYGLQFTAYVYRNIKADLFELGFSRVHICKCWREVQHRLDDKKTSVIWYSWRGYKKRTKNPNIQIISRFFLMEYGTHFKKNTDYRNLEGYTVHTTKISLKIRRGQGGGRILNFERTPSFFIFVIIYAGKLLARKKHWYAL